jgi:hypothetical protein
MNRWTMLALGGVLISTAPGLAQWTTARARPTPLPGLPAYPYQPTATSAQTTPPKPVATGTGLPRLDLGTPPDPLRAPAPFDLGTSTTTRETTTTRTTAGRRGSDCTTTTVRETTITSGGTGFGLPPTDQAAVFTLLDEVIRVDHCTLSKVSVAIYPDGKYLVSFRADQNPLPADPLTPTLRTRGTAIDTGTEAGQFRRNRFYVTVRGYAADPLGERTVGATKAAVLELPLDPFWVNRGETYSGKAEGTSEAVKRNFKLIDRVDVDLTYR